MINASPLLKKHVTIDGESIGSFIIVLCMRRLQKVLFFIRDRF